MAKQCSQCHLVSPDSAEHCQCGQILGNVLDNSTFPSVTRTTCWSYMELTAFALVTLYALYIINFTYDFNASGLFFGSATLTILWFIACRRVKSAGVTKFGAVVCYSIATLPAIFIPLMLSLGKIGGEAQGYAIIGWLMLFPALWLLAGIVVFISLCREEL